VSAAADSDIWILQFGSPTKTPVAHWDGTAWTDLSPTFPTGTLLGGLWATGHGEAWLSIELPLPLTPDLIENYQGGLYHWAGSAWTKVPSPIDAIQNQQIGALWSASPHDVWATYRGGVIHWDGAAWAAVPNVPLAPGEAPAVLWGSSDDDVWVAAFGGANPRMLHFDGSAWGAVTLPTPDDIVAIWGSCPSNFWAISSSASFGVTTLWRFDGLTWTAVQANGSSKLAPTIAGGGPDDVWLISLTSASNALHWTPNRCGDLTVGPGEQCDPPHLGPDGLQCDQTCHLLTCGNGIIDPGEQCDPPKSTGSFGLCTQSCQLPSCGNGTIDPGETCEPPGTTVCDVQCQTIPTVCGDNLVQAGETCDFSNTQLCKNCQLTNCGTCFVNAALLPSAEALCAGLNLADTVACNQLASCLAVGIGQCISTKFGALSCLCSSLVTPCSAGVDGPCGSAFEALAHSTDPAVIAQQIRDKTTPVGKVSNAAVLFATSCGAPCSQTP
jgi:hypothetical protein